MNALSLKRLLPYLALTVATLLTLPRAHAAPEPKVSVEFAVTNGKQLLVAPATVALSADAVTRQQNHPIVRVEFYNGANLIATATTAPYQALWGPVAAGTYSLTAKAINDKGDSATSSPISLSVDAAPSVALTAPAANSIVSSQTGLPLTASATDSDGTIAKVEFYNGTTLIGTATTAPYTVTWNPVSPGSYRLTARATDDRGASTTSVAVPITVNAPPTVALAVAGAPYVAPANATLSASAADVDGTIARVEFFNGTTLIGTATSAPYTLPLTALGAGSYSLTARATDNVGDTSTSAPVGITVAPNQLPTVTLTRPTPNQVVAAPASLTVSANATDADGTIAQVEFYNGPTLIGTATAAPYTMTWSNVPSGRYSLTAVATDDKGGVATAAAVTVTVNALPTVTLTHPTPNQIVAAPATITVTANASDTDGGIAQVEFYNGATLIGTATAAPYTVTWSNVPSGSYSLTAIAMDTLGGQVTSAPMAITVDAPPAVTLTSPNAGAVGLAPANFTLTANATDSDGTIAKVEFFNGATLIGTATSPTAPYTLNWNAVGAGSYSLTATATDNLGLQTTSAPINVSVIANSAPAVSLTSPTPNQSFKAPATITLTANASDADNNLAKVEFWQNGTLIATLLTPPYTTTWSTVPQGSYQITAMATDAVGAQTASAPTTINVTPAQASLYFIHPDHLGTPRLVTDEQNTVVWRHLPTTEPFGNTPPEEDPNATGNRFEMPLAFPGQYRDRESNLNYNYFRDYDPATGRYRQSDPIGLQGGINTYGYVLGNPISYTDPKGEAVPALAICVACPACCAAAAAAAGAAAANICMAENNKSTRKKIEGLEEQIDEHEKKIQNEPDCDAVCHWEKEIKAWKERIERLRKRLPGGG